MRIFLVGKIDRYDWRHLLVKGLDERLETLDVAKEGWPVMENSIFSVHDFLGPYFCSIPKGATETIKTHRLCLKGIDEADLVFCWFDNAEAYASLFEMGYAHAKGKYTVVAYPKGFDRREFWFLSCCADEFMEVDSPVAGLMLAMMKMIRAGRIANPAAELEKVQRNMEKLKELDQMPGGTELPKEREAHAEEDNGSRETTDGR